MHLLLLALVAAASPVVMDALTPQLPYEKCPLDIPVLCSNSTPVSDFCCFESPGGVVLQTQFWDYYPPVGPSDMFTLHGLWPDNCDGTYAQFCNNDLNVGLVLAVLQEFGEDELLATMNRVWKNFNGNDELLWVHEFNKHGTCMLTLNPACYGNGYRLHENVRDYFKVAVERFQQLPTAEWLADAGIVPHELATYSRAQIEDALAARYGHPVRVLCNRYHALQEVWYFYHVRGLVLGGGFVPIPSLGHGTCPEDGIHFYPKGWRPLPLPTNTKPGVPGPTGSPSRGFLKLSGQPGCLISNGKWYTSGQCATYLVTKAPFGGYQIRLSKGYCGISGLGEFTCNRQVDPLQFQFQLDKSTGVVSYGGKDQWSAPQRPSRFSQVGVSPGTDGDIVFQLVFA